MSGMNVEWAGMDKFRALIATAPERVTLASGAAIYEEGNAIMAVSRHLVPVETGTLRASGFVDMPHVEGMTVSVELGYGGAASAYAMIQHERMDYRHRVGQAKYLEQPFLEAQRGMEIRLGRSVAKALA